MTDDELRVFARRALSVLVNHVVKYRGGVKYMTYSELAQGIKFPKPYAGNLFGLRIGQVLGTMGHMWDGVIIDGEPVPLIQSLVVGKSTGLPSDGIKEFTTTYPNLSPEKKRDFASNEYERIFRFGARWIRLLSKLRIPPSSALVKIATNARKGFNTFGPEGSPEHRRLRDRIVENPNLIGLTGDYKATVEYPLKSGDSIDIVLETEKELVAVEVKSIRSGPDDLERGLFQIIKYEFVLKAEAKVRGDRRSIRVVLATQPILQKQALSISKKLGSRVFMDL